MATAEGADLVAVATRLSTADLSALTDAEAVTTAVDALHGLAVVQAQVWRRIGEVIARQAYRIAGYPDADSWLQSTHGLSPAEARRWVIASRALYSDPDDATDGDRTGSVPAPPNDAHPDDTHPDDARPDGAYPDGARSTEDVPNGAQPAGDVPSPSRPFTITRQLLEGGDLAPAQVEAITAALTSLAPAIERRAQAEIQARTDRPDARSAEFTSGAETVAPPPTYGSLDEVPVGPVVATDAAAVRGELEAEIEDLLVTTALDNDMAATRRTIRVLEQILTPEQVEEERRRDHERRHLSLTRNRRGGFDVRGYLAGTAAETLATAIDAMSAPKPATDGTPDPRTAGQRRADAMTDLAGRTLDDARLPLNGGARPHVHILVPLTGLAPVHANPGDSGHGVGDPADAGAVAGAAGGVTSLGAVISQAEARELACDAHLTRIVVQTIDDPHRGDGRPLGLTAESGTSSGRRPEEVRSALHYPRTSRAADRSTGPPITALARALLAPSRPLDVGRAERSVTAPMRAAVVARDRECAFPGCHRPPPWCVTHHIRHWADGGPTSLQNLVLLCGHHHRTVHHDGWRVWIEPGTGLPSVEPPNPAPASRARAS